jgi:hypothetical protein
MAAAALVANVRPGAMSVRKSTVVLAGLLALSCLTLVGRNTSTQLDFWFVVGPTIAGLAIAVFTASLGVYAKQRSQSSPPSAKSGVTRVFRFSATRASASTCGTRSASILLSSRLPVGGLADPRGRCFFSVRFPSRWEFRSSLIARSKRRSSHFRSRPRGARG